MTYEVHLHKEHDMIYLDGKYPARSTTFIIPGSAGELVQGQMSNGEDFLITNPVRCFSKVQVSICAGHGMVSVFPDGCTKVKKAILLTLAFFGVTSIDVRVHVNSQIPIGKGMASSTSDIIGSIEALAQMLGQSITPEQVSKIAISIEPSDGLMYRGTVAYNHRCGKIIEYLGPVPPTIQLVIDTGGCVDTIDFNQTPKIYTQDEIDIIARAFNLVKEGIKTSDFAKIGQGATMSARVNQRFLPKNELEAIIEFATYSGALGVICAHSGTILSLLFASDNVQGLRNAILKFKDSSQKYIITSSVSTW